MKYLTPVANEQNPSACSGVRWSGRATLSSTAFAEGGYPTMAVEHLHLHMRRTHWETKCHENLGAHLQDALDKLDQEGWEVVSVFCVDRTPEVIMKRERVRPAAAPTQS